MKKLKGLDTRQIKQFFVQNVEKIVFGVSMLVVALLVYGAIGQEPYAKTPEELKRSVASAQENIQRIKTLPAKDVPPEPRFVEMAQRSTENVPAAGFETLSTWNVDPGLKLGTRRGEPAFLAVQELEVSSGTGPFAYKNKDVAARFAGVNPGGAALPGAVPPGVRQPGAAPGQMAVPPAPAVRQPGGRPARGSLQGLLPGAEGAAPGPEAFAGEGQPGMGAGAIAAVSRGVQASPDSLVEGVRWVCVTGLVPYREQIKKYNDEFAAAQYTDPSKDSPFWMGYLIERSEVTAADLKDASKAKWVKISVNSARDLTANWAIRAAEVVNPAFTDESLTFPLGPLLERNWGKDVAHSKIPVLDVTQRGATAGMEAGMAVEDQGIAAIASRTEGTDLDAMLKKRQTRGAAGPGSEGMAPGGRVMQRAAPPRAMMRGMGEGGFQPPGGEGMQGSGAYGGQAGQPEQEIEYLLFRFFDFTVEEGKRYRYRVQLVLENPNHGLKAQYLKDAALARDPYKLSPVSEPSPVASVNSFNELYAGPVKYADKPIDEPKVNLIAVQLDPKMGTKAVYEMRKPEPKEKREMLPVNRGQLIQFSAKVDVVHPITRKVEEKAVDFNSNMVLLDIRGGDPFSPGNIRDRDTLPGEVLLMDPNGSLFVRTETTDEVDYVAESEWLKMLKMAKENNAQAPLGGLPEGGGGEGAPPVRRGRAGEGS